MSQNDIISKVAELQEYKRMREELDALIECISDELKAHMNANNADTLTAGSFKVSYKAYTSSRLDTAALKRELPDIVAKYSKQATTRRLTIN
ncbi:MAG: hypothetical protein IJ418_17095 [Clostridia bacterium]|nr:hypothetical protein [Clostridia bacterium]